MTDPDPATRGCDTCGATPPHGGGYDYTDTRGRPRYGCLDERGCSATYARLKRRERDALDKARRAL